MPRKDRGPDQLRSVTLVANFTDHAEGSVLCSFGRTRVLCTATAEERVPSYVKGSGRGWVTAEYGMLPRSTHTRTDREAAKGKQSGRTQEIQRLIGRSLLARGYVVVRDAAEKVVTDAVKVRPNAALELEFYDGKVGAIAGGSRRPVRRTVPPIGQGNLFEEK